MPGLPPPKSMPMLSNISVSGHYLSMLIVKSFSLRMKYCKCYIIPSFLLGLIKRKPTIISTPKYTLQFLDSVSVAFSEGWVTSDRVQ